MLYVNLRGPFLTLLNCLIVCLSCCIISVSHKRIPVCLCSHGVLFSVYVFPLLSGVSYTGGSARSSGDLHC